MCVRARKKRNFIFIFLSFDYLLLLFFFIQSINSKSMNYLLDCLRFRRGVLNRPPHPIRADRDRVRSVWSEVTAPNLIGMDLKPSKKKHRAQTHTETDPDRPTDSRTDFDSFILLSFFYLLCCCYRKSVDPLLPYDGSKKNAQTHDHVSQIGITGCGLFILWRYYLEMSTVWFWMDAVDTFVFVNFQFCDKVNSKYC